MRITRILLAGCLAALGSVATAGGHDIYQGDHTNDPNSNFLVHSYHATNYCPQGLQPVSIGGVICCGTPNAGAYIDRPGRAHRPMRAHHRPARQVVVGEKGVVFR